MAQSQGGSRWSRFAQRPMQISADVRKRVTSRAEWPVLGGKSVLSAIETRKSWQRTNGGRPGRAARGSEITCDRTCVRQSLSPASASSAARWQGAHTVTPPACDVPERHLTTRNLGAGPVLFFPSFGENGETRRRFSGSRPQYRSLSGNAILCTHNRKRHTRVTRA